MTAGSRLSLMQMEALSLIARYGFRYTDDPDVYSPVTSAKTCLSDGQPWINCRTAYALERKGYGRVQGYGEETEFVLFNGTRFGEGDA